VSSVSVAQQDQGDVVLSVRGLVTEFASRSGAHRAVDGLSFDLRRGETLGIVGESGSGKSVAMLSISRLLRAPGKVVAGEALLDGVDLLVASAGELRHLLGQKISMVFQDPMTSLNPVMTIGRQIAEVMTAHRPGLSRRAARAEAVEILGSVGVPDPSRRFDQYPHEFSGGMRQRVVIAMAIANNPDVLIADEPTTALDATVQAQLLELLNKIKSEHGIATILITHDLRVIAETADRVLVMYGGRAVEEGTVDSVFSNPRHPYTVGLLASIPSIEDRREQLDAIPGQPPGPTDNLTGCRFEPRCTFATAECTSQRPELRLISKEQHRTACHHAEKLISAEASFGELIS
jgi:peptide/nickel transport system ATP-binding protein